MAKYRQVSIPQWCDCCCEASRRRCGTHQFQSHNGAIAARTLSLLPAGIIKRFNPTMVRLLLFSLRFSLHCVGGFNPTMVRLLLWRGIVAAMAALLFQSHNGAIAATLIKKAKKITLMFQSHNGAIAASIRTGSNSNLRVSIPQWCDCCTNIRQACYLKSNVSIPQWCDCCCQGCS